MRPYYEHAGITIYHGDCREVLASGAISGARIVLTDPPYSFGMASTAHEGKAGGWGDMMNAASFYATCLGLFRGCVANQQGCAWVFNSWRSLPVLMRAAFESVWPIESMLVWDKEWIGPGGPVGLRPSWECAALFASPGFAISNRGIRDVWPAKWHPGAHETEHPAEKPVALLSRMLVVSGEGVALDPFMGSGSTLVAAKAAGRSAIGIEIEERWCEVAARRLAQEVLLTCGSESTSRPG